MDEVDAVSQDDAAVKSVGVKVSATTFSNSIPTECLRPFHSLELSFAARY